MQHQTNTRQILKLKNELEKQAVLLIKLRKENIAKDIEIKGLKKHISNLVKNSCRNASTPQASYSRQEYTSLLRDNYTLQDQLSKLEQVNNRLMKNIETNSRQENKSSSHLDRFLEKGVNLNSRALQGGLPSLGKKR